MISMAVVCNCVRRLHPDLRHRVNNDTLIKYQKAVECFTMYLHRQPDLSLHSAEDLDLMIMEYRTEMDLTKAQHVTLVAAVEFFLPYAKGKLVICREALKGRAASEPTKHTIPLTTELAWLFGAYMASQGKSNIGAAMIVQQATGLRPSELLALQRDRIFVPRDCNQSITLRLGSVVSTKVKREQFVLVRPGVQSLAYALLRSLSSTAAEGAKLFPFGYSTYNNAFKSCERHYQLEMGFTAHSPRAGFATSQLKISKLREDGFVRAVFKRMLMLWLQLTLGPKCNPPSYKTPTSGSASVLNSTLASRTPMSRSRAASVDKPDFRSRLVRDMIPDPPDYMSTHQKRQWRMQQWDELWSTKPAPKAKAEPSPKAWPSAKARAAAFFGGGNPRQRRWISPLLPWGCCSWSFCGPWLLLLFFLVSTMGGDRGLLASFATFSGAALQLGEASSIAAGQALNLTGMVAASATDVVSAVATNGLTAADNAWRGVDILELEATRCSALLTMDGSEVLQEWFSRPVSNTMVPCLSDSLRAHLLAAAATVSLGMPLVQFADENVSLHSSFDSLKVWGQLLPTGKVQLTFELIRMSFTLAWSNPLWDHFHLDVQTERPQILRSLRRTLHELPQPSVPLHQPALDLQVSFSWPMLRARCRAWLRRFLLEVSTNCWIWMVETFRGSGAVNEWGVFFLVLVPPFLVMMLFLCLYYSQQVMVPTQLAPEPMTPLALRDATDASPVDTQQLDLSGISEESSSSVLSMASSVASSFQLVNAVAKPPVDGSGESPVSAYSELLETGEKGS